MNNVTIENLKHEKFIDPIINTISEIQNLFASYSNKDWSEANEKFVKKVLFDALNRATIANNVISPREYEDWFREIWLLKRAYGDIESAMNVLTKTMSNMFPQEEINHIIDKNFKPTLDVLDITIRKLMGTFNGNE